MEFEGTMSEMQPTDWRELLPGVQKPLRIGQASSFAYAAIHQGESALIVQPTGYGKSITAMGYYLILRARGIVNRALWLVPTERLRLQLVPKPIPGKIIYTAADEAREFFQVGCGEAIAIEKVARDLRYHFSSIGEFFIASYQQVANQDGFFPELMPDIGNQWRWLVICDEAHHLADDAKWGPAAQALPAAYRLYMSGTPIRTDRKLLTGVPVKKREGDTWTYDAAVDVSYDEAFDEQALRRPRGHIEHYFVDAETADGERVQITTETLAEEGVTDVSAYEVKRGLRYCGDYLAPIITDAMLKLDEKLIKHPNQHQMIVFAMTCAHAEVLANDHFNGIEPGCADWVGVTRSDIENQRVLDRFDNNKLKILVQVAKLGEGYNNKRCSVALFLHLIQSETRLTQEIGRCLRRNPEIPFDEDVADIFASADTPVAERIRELDASLDSYREGGTDEPPRPPRDRWYDISDMIYLNGAQWYRTDVVNPKAQYQPPEPWMMIAAQREGIPLDKLQRLLSYQPKINGQTENGNTLRNETEKLAFYQEQVKLATKTLARNIAGSCSKDGGFRADILGAIKTAANSEWKKSHRRHDEMIADDFKEKHEWLQQTNRECRSGFMPEWLMRTINKYV